MALPKKVSTALIFAFAAAMLGMIAYGVLTHEEPGLLTACTGPDRIALYDGDCFEVRWKSLPLEVRAHRANADEHQALVLVIAAINLRLRMNAFVLLDPGAPSGDVDIYFNMPPESYTPKEGGTTTHWFDEQNKVRRAESRLYNVALYEHLVATLYHELGHVLGLDHDDYVGSAMRIGSTMEESYSDHDVKLLRQIYGKYRGKAEAD